MNIEELSEILEEEPDLSRAGQRERDEAAAMLRAQHAAIRTLREALEGISKTKPQHGMNPNAYMSDPDDIKVGWNVHWAARKALAATEEIK